MPRPRRQIHAVPDCSLGATAAPGQAPRTLGTAIEDEARAAAHATGRAVELEKARNDAKCAPRLHELDRTGLVARSSALFYDRPGLLVPPR
jgi:hypothetical protein